jgi:hypothetical protein
MLIYKSKHENRNYKTRYIDNAPFRGIKLSDKTRNENLTLYERCLALQKILPDNSAISYYTAIKLLNIGQPWGLENNDVIHVTIFNSKKRIRRVGVKAHYVAYNSNAKIPIITLKGLRVVAPELLWFSMITKLTYQESIVLGSLLVSNNHSITTVKKIKTFVDTRYKCVGHKRAYKQLKDIVLGTDSPMETRIHLQIQKWGLPKFHTNYPIYIDNEILMLADGALPDKKICFEYDGRDFHSDPAKILSDKRKRNIARAAGWHVIVLTYEDYVHPEKYLLQIQELLS